MIEKLRSLADQLDKATPGTWEIGESHESKVEVGVDGKVFCRVQVPRSWSFEEKVSDSVDVAEAICLGHNDGPSVLREAADEIERLQDGSLRQYLTDQNTQLREQLVIVCDENEHLQREIERLQRVVDQATKWLCISSSGDIFAISLPDDLNAKTAPDLAAELECQRGEK